jgi:hypothetical protein
MFAIVAVPFDAYAALPRPEYRWLLTCLARYANRARHGWPMRRSNPVATVAGFIGSAVLMAVGRGALMLSWLLMPPRG